MLFWRHIPRCIFWFWEYITNCRHSSIFRLMALFRGCAPCRFYCLGGFRYIFRRTGGTWKRHSFITDFTLPVCCGYHPNCVFSQQAFRSGWRLECVLDHGSDYSNHFYLCLLQGNSTKPAEPANSKMNVAFPLGENIFF